jgi:hypothetical protein
MLEGRVLQKPWRKNEWHQLQAGLCWLKSREAREDQKRKKHCPANLNHARDVVHMYCHPCEPSHGRTYRSMNLGGRIE